MQLSYWHNCVFQDFSKRGAESFLHFTVRCYAQLGIPMEYRRPL